MAALDPITQRLLQLAQAPARVRALGAQRINKLLLDELGRSRRRIDELTERYPSASRRELAQRLIDSKKGLAGTLGGVTGVFGLASLPLDWVAMMWIQLVLLVDLATLHKVNLKSTRNRDELLELFGYANGLQSLKRVSPKLFGQLATMALARGKLKLVGRVVPLLSSPLIAYMNNQQIQVLGQYALRHYGGFEKARGKLKRGA